MVQGKWVLSTSVNKDLGFRSSSVRVQGLGSPTGRQTEPPTRYATKLGGQCYDRDRSLASQRVLGGRACPRLKIGFWARGDVGLRMILFKTDGASPYLEAP